MVRFKRLPVRFAWLYGYRLGFLFSIHGLIEGSGAFLKKIFDGLSTPLLFRLFYLCPGSYLPKLVFWRIIDKILKCFFWGILTSYFCFCSFHFFKVKIFKVYSSFLQGNARFVTFPLYCGGWSYPFY